MSDRPNQDGPMFVWTFPLITRMQNRSGIVDFGQRTSSVSDTVKEVTDSKPIRSTVSDKLTSDEDETTDEEPESSDDILQLESQIEEVQENSEQIFNQEYSQPQTETVEISDEVFVPLRTEVDVGDTVEWENNDDTVHRVVSTSGEEISSDQIEPGETFTHTFDEDGVTEYIDSIVGGDVMCGAIIVGDAEFEGNLQCEQDVERELFTDDADGSRTMAAAAEEKDDMDIGF